MINLRLAAIILAAATLAACKPAEPPADAPPPVAAPAAPGPVATAPAPVGKIMPITSEGFGPLKVGMSETAAEAAIGGFAPGQASTECHYRSPKDPSLGLLVMFEEGMVSSIRTARDSTLQSDHAIALGATEAGVRTAYSGALVEEAHKYRKAPAKRLLHWDSEPLRGVLYEIDENGKVIGIYAGGPSIRYVEGCS